MSNIDLIFSEIKSLTYEDGQTEFMAIIKTLYNADQSNNGDSGGQLISYIKKIYDVIDKLCSEIQNDNTILISLKNQKLLRICFQLITCLAISPCLLPGLGIPLSKRCTSFPILPTVAFSDEQKYEILSSSTNFFTRCYNVPVFRNIINTSHLSDYLASLIQLSFAPLKKPGTYNNFTMTQEIYEKLLTDRQYFVNIYEHLVNNSFQPMLIKELLILQSIQEPTPPTFVKRVIAKELSRRLLNEGGLLNLVRCFIESHIIDTGVDWKKVDTICQIVTGKHGCCSQNEYLRNICGQISQMLNSNNNNYLSSAVSCLCSLYEKYPESDEVNIVVKQSIQSLTFDYLNSLSVFPGTVILSPEQIDNKINIMYACSCAKLHCSVKLLKPNLHVLFLIGSKCTKNHEQVAKLKDIILKCLESLNKEEISEMLQLFLFENETNKSINISIEEYEAGIIIKSLKVDKEDENDHLSYFISLFNASSDSNFVKNVFEISLQILTNLSVDRKIKTNKDMLLLEDKPLLLNKYDEQYIIILHLLSEISTSPGTVKALTKNPLIILQFIEHFILKEYETNDECSSIALVLLNTVVSNSNNLKDFKEKLSNFLPRLTTIANDTSAFNHIIAKEILSVIKSSGAPNNKNSQYDKAIDNVFDNLLPVRAHGLIELTRLIDVLDPEAISKKHYILCLFQEQLKDSDSYIYLSAINGLAALATHCSEDVLHVLCKEFLQSCSRQQHCDTTENISELRMKIGDVIVKVTKKLGEMAVVHKTILLNTMLCACRDEDPLIRTSGLSNLAEITLVLHYKLGSIIHEILLCVWGIVETDKAIECRRAAVMVISSLIKGLGKETLIQLKDNLLPIYRTLKELYRNGDEDSIVRLHAQIALEELDEVVTQFLFPELKMEKQMFVADKPDIVFK